MSGIRNQPSVLGYLAAVPEGGGIVGKRCMATLTHMSTGGLQYERAVLKSISRCVTSQLFMFDRPVTKEEEEEVDEEEVIDERHDTLIAGISGFVAMTGHAEILHPVVNVVGGWVATVAKEWTTAKDPLTQDFVWKSGELLKYMRLTTAACTFRKTSLNFGSQLKMMRTLHELWDPNPDIEAQGTGWFGLRHLGHHIDVKDKRLSSRKMKRMIGKVQKATIELFQRLCKHGYALTHTEAMMAAATTDTDTDDESKSGYRSPGDIVYVIDKTANTWPAYVRCIVVRCVGTRGGGGMGDGTDDDNDNDDDDEVGKEGDGVLAQEEEGRKEAPARLEQRRKHHSQAAGSTQPERAAVNEKEDALSQAKGELPLSPPRLPVDSDGDSTFGLSAKQSARLQLQFDAGCERPNKKQIKSISSKVGVTPSQCKYWFKRRRAHKHLLANRQTLLKNGGSGGVRGSAASSAKMTAGSKNNNNESAADAVQLRDTIRRIARPSYSAMDIAAANMYLCKAVGVEGEPGACPHRSVAGGRDLLQDAFSGDASADLKAAIGLMARNRVREEGIRRRFCFHGTVVRKRMCSHTVFYSLMPSSVSKAEADQSLSLVRHALSEVGAGAGIGIGIVLASSAGGAKAGAAAAASTGATAASADAKTGWNGKFVAPDGIIPTVQVAVCRSFLDNEKYPRLWPAWKRGVKEGDVVQCIGAPGRTGTGQSTFFCWDVSIIGEGRGRLEV